MHLRTIKDAGISTFSCLWHKDLIDPNWNVDSSDHRALTDNDVMFGPKIMIFSPQTTVQYAAMRNTLRGEWKTSKYSYVKSYVYFYLN